MTTVIPGADLHKDCISAFSDLITMITDKMSSQATVVDNLKAQVHVAQTSLATSDRVEEFIAKLAELATSGSPIETALSNNEGVVATLGELSMCASIVYAGLSEAKKEGVATHAFAAVLSLLGLAVQYRTHQDAQACRNTAETLKTLTFSPTTMESASIDAVAVMSELARDFIDLGAEAQALEDCAESDALRLESNGTLDKIGDLLAKHKHAEALFTKCKAAAMPPGVRQLASERMAADLKLAKDLAQRLASCHTSSMQAALKEQASKSTELAAGQFGTLNFFAALTAADADPENSGTFTDFTKFLKTTIMLVPAKTYEDRVWALQSSVTRYRDSISRFPDLELGVEDAADIKIIKDQVADLTTIMATIDLVVAFQAASKGAVQTAVIKRMCMEHRKTLLGVGRTEEALHPALRAIFLRAIKTGRVAIDDDASL
jgi:hypothetical protein